MARLALVTGASSGIGQACATRLLDLGFHVLAGVRKATDAPNRTEALQLDVTSEDDVAAAAERVGAKLHVLVNNAGVAVSGPVEVVPIEGWRRQLEVNLVGQVAVTRALLPAVLRARGRIVNMSSIGGRVANPLFGPLLGVQVRARGDERRAPPRGLAPRGPRGGRGAGRHRHADLGQGPRRTRTAMLEGADPEAAAPLRPNDRRPCGARPSGCQREGLPPEAVADVVGKAVTRATRARGTWWGGTRGPGRGGPAAAGPRVRRPGRRAT